MPEIIYPKSVLSWTEQIKKNLNKSPELKKKLITNPGLSMGLLLEALAIASYNKFVSEGKVELTPEEIAEQGKILENEREIIEQIRTEQLMACAVTEDNVVLFNYPKDNINTKDINKLFNE